MNKNDPLWLELHDNHLLQLLKDAPSWEIFKQEVSSSTKEPCPDIRFTMANEDKTRWITVGASLFTTTSPFGLGKPVINFFSFYCFSDKAEFKEFLYNSELYVWKRGIMWPYKNNWWNRFAKWTNDWSKRCWTDTQFIAKTGENPTHLEYALMSCVLHLARTKCPQEFKTNLKMEIL